MQPGMQSSLWVSVWLYSIYCRTSTALHSSLNCPTRVLRGTYGTKMNFFTPVTGPCGHAHFNLVAFPIGPFTTSTFTTSALQLALQEQSHENSCLRDDNKFKEPQR
jgi:hypothetical protein